MRLTHQAVVWGLRAQGVEYLSVAVAWHTASTSILTRTWQTIAGDLDRLEGVHTLGVDVPAARFTIKREVPPLSGAALSDGKLCQTLPHFSFLEEAFE